MSIEMWCVLGFAYLYAGFALFCSVRENCGNTDDRCAAFFGSVLLWPAYPFYKLINDKS